jgi:hypothetical protein
MRNASRSSWEMIRGAIAIAALCFFLWSGDEPDQTARGVTTESVAAAAGAEVLATDPQLEPK